LNQDIGFCRIPSNCPVQAFSGQHRNGEKSTNCTYQIALPILDDPAFRSVPRQSCSETGARRGEIAFGGTEPERQGQLIGRGKLGVLMPLPPESRIGTGIDEVARSTSQTAIQDRISQGTSIGVNRKFLLAIWVFPGTNPACLIELILPFGPMRQFSNLFMVEAPENALVSAGGPKLR
jgi:hypothetical protein